jgi:hypothetical protein
MMSSGGGGCCDCGDASSWDSAGFCKRHRGAVHSQSLNLSKFWPIAGDEAHVLSAIRFLIGIVTGALRSDSGSNVLMVLEKCISPRFRSGATPQTACSSVFLLNH